MLELPPNPGEPEGVTRLLVEWRNGDPEALDRLTPIVYDELRRLARRYMRREARSDVLQTTALVHEAYLRLVGEDVAWEGRSHFFAVAAKLMRRILVDFARRRQAQKRGKGEVLSLEEVERRLPGIHDGPDVELLALDAALRRLAEFDDRKSRILELRFFGGLTIEETGRALQISHATVERDFRLAKAWLSDALGV